MNLRPLLLIPIGLAIAFVLMQVGGYMDIADALAPAQPFEVSAARSATDAASRLSTLSSEQTQRYARWQWIDLGVAAANTMILACLILVPFRSWNRRDVLRHVVMVIVAAPFLAECGENLALLLMFRELASDSITDAAESAAAMAGGMTMLKWSALGCAVICMLINWIIVGVRVVAKRGSAATSRAHSATA